VGALAALGVEHGLPQAAREAAVPLAVEVDNPALHRLVGELSPAGS
jgi:hypothetical protein